MANYGTLNEASPSPTKRYYKVNGVDTTTSFKYTETFFNHFEYCHVVDDNNHRQMQPISIEETWKTSFWSHRPFAFFLGVTTANAQYGYEYFGQHENESVLQFPQILAKEMIFNKWVPKGASSDSVSTPRRSKRAKVKECELLTLPPKKQFSGFKMVDSNANYNQWKCVCGRYKRQTYCKCSPGFIRCPECYAEHRIECEMEKETDALNSVIEKSKGSPSTCLTLTVA